MVYQVTIASGTGVLRIYNNRHWLTDVAAGGIGILYQNCVLVVSKMQNYFKKQTNAAVMVLHFIMVNKRD
jgi:hypothetical protein